MRDPLAEDLRGGLWVQGSLALLLALQLILGTVGLAVAVYCSMRLPDAGLWVWLAPLALLLVLDVWALRRSLKAANLLWAFGRWPSGLGAAGLEAPDALNLRAAREAFQHGELERCQRLMDRLPGSLAQAPLWLARGRCLALLGRMEEAWQALERGGEAPYLLGWLKRRRWLGVLEVDPYLSEADATHALHSLPSILTVLVLCLGLAGVAWPYVSAVQDVLARRAADAAKDFDVSGFKVGSHGRFVVYYHDLAFANQVWDIADDALDQDLGFLGLPSDTFKPEQIRLFLCDDQAEYLRRSPHPVAWEAACALPERDAIFIYREPNNRIYFEIVLAHELSHLAYHQWGIKGVKDSWLNEGLADYLGFRYGLEKYRVPRQAWLMEHEFKDLRKHALPFNQFFQVEPHQLPAAEVGTFYTQGASMVYMLIENYGREAFLTFMHHYAITGNIDRSLAAAYPTLPSVDAVGAVWGLFFQQAETATAPLR